MRGRIKREWVLGVVGGLGLLAGAAILWEMSEGEAVAEATPGRSFGLGNGLSDAYVEEEPAPPVAPPPPKQEKPKVVKAPQRSRQVLGGDNRFEDPNNAIAKRYVESMAQGEGYVDVAALEAEAAAGDCLVRDGTTFPTMQRGGLLQLTRPLVGENADTGEPCAAAREGSTLALTAAESEDDPLCAIRLDTTGAARASYNLSCWEVYEVRGGRGRSDDGAVYNIRVVEDALFQRS